MSGSSPSDPVPAPPDTGPGGRPAMGWLSLAIVLEVALALRVGAADLVEWYVRGRGQARLDLLPDTDIYWELARALRAGGPFEYVEWGDIPHFAIRTPGYPLFLAACQSAFGERTLPVRLVQAVLGTLCVYLVYQIARRLAPSGRDRWTTAVPIVAGAVAAIHPQAIAMSALVLSEAAFEPLMLASLLAVAALWPSKEPGRRNWLIAMGGGVAAGAAVMVRPSWLLFVPILLAAWVVAGRRGRDARSAITGALIFALTAVLVMAPWWVRNAQVYGRFVPTALWMGASLYDGLNPEADGGSSMLGFLRDPAIWPLDEQDQDAELTRRALDFARNHPSQALELGLDKLGRYWSPWPRGGPWWLAIACALVEIPVLASMALGLWDRRRDLRAWVLLAGPILYFAALHMAFASSMRYRIPGELPALTLSAIGWVRLTGRPAAREHGPGMEDWAMKSRVDDYI